MFKTLFIAFILILASCTYTSNQPNTPTQQPPLKVMQYGTGESVAWQLNERFNETRTNCGTATQPAFLCSGVLIKYTRYSPSPHIWDNTEESHRKGGVSFAWLRTDSRFVELLSEEGYLFSPPFYTTGKLAPEVLCSFPMSALWFLREGTGCGAMPNLPTSGPCQPQGVTSASGWYDHFKTTGGEERQCGFDVRRALGAGATTAFIATLGAQKLIERNHYEGACARTNELVLAVWPDGEGRNLPLQAFWYSTAWGIGGRENAQRNQLEFKNVTGLSVPIIAVTIPRETTGEFRFDYRTEDQVIDIP